jgi:hypothetical protein
MDSSTTRQTARQEAWQGMNWCRPTTRLAVYLRDGLACCYCGATVEQGATLSLDHVRPHSAGGGNEVTNLVTCCSRCNSARGSRPLAVWARAVAEYLDHGIDAADILRHIAACRRRVLPRAEARQLIARRGTVAAALKGEAV